jgi:hypothetical protein
LINFEEQFFDLLTLTLKDNDSLHLRTFLKQYLPSIAGNNVNYIRLYYEKSLQSNPDDEDLWEDFILYLKDKKYKVSKKLLLSTLTKSCKCCYFKITFWIQLFREKERQAESKESILKKVSEAYISCEDERSKYEIWKYSIEYYCRTTDICIEESVKQLRQEFEKFTSYLESSPNKDYLLKIYMIWAEYETYKLKDKSKMKDIMEKVVRMCQGEEFYWNSYIQFCKFFDDTKLIRAIYKRACQYSNDEQNRFSQQWILWEKMY